jgi:hypothetical protein
MILDGPGALHFAEHPWSEAEGANATRLRLAVLPTIVAEDLSGSRVWYGSPPLLSVKWAWVKIRLRLVAKTSHLQASHYHYTTN